ncbi:MAG TPA: HAMP domain-containing sensor histidine kinase [Candidatus Bathyarchaeia archaeon]|nr:HAMP domain-containing sensor histidine kinase [Candidatus Bathyarchaeia archaeon]
MLKTVAMNIEEITKKILMMSPAITAEWLREVEKHDIFPMSIPRDYAEKRTILIARSLVENVDAPMQAWALEMSEWMRSQRYPFSAILRVYQLYRSVFWSVLRSSLTAWNLTQDDILYLEKRIGHAMDESVYWATYHYEQLINRELTQKEETISFLHNDKLTILGKVAANMAHELRNPLCAIEGFLKLIGESTKEQPKLQSYIDVIMHEFENLHRQITGFLSFSKKPILDEVYKETSLVKLLNDVELLITPRLVGENVLLQKDISVSCTLYCYEEGLKQVLLNLLHNAIDAVSKKTDKQIHIYAYTDREKLSLIVENNGEAVPKEILDELFQPFFTTKRNGTGIGLSICKNIIEKHNGDIRCESDAEKTRFIITLPFL